MGNKHPINHTIQWAVSRFGRYYWFRTSWLKWASNQDFKISWIKWHITQRKNRDTI